MGKTSPDALHEQAVRRHIEHLERMLDNQSKEVVTDGDKDATQSRVSQYVKRVAASASASPCTTASGPSGNSSKTPIARSVLSTSMGSHGGSECSSSIVGKEPREKEPREKEGSEEYFFGSHCEVRRSPKKAMRDGSHQSRRKSTHVAKDSQAAPEPGHTRSSSTFKEGRETKDQSRRESWIPSMSSFYAALGGAASEEGAVDHSQVSEPQRVRSTSLLSERELSARTHHQQFQRRRSENKRLNSATRPASQRHSSAKR